MKAAYALGLLALALLFWALATDAPPRSSNGAIRVRALLCGAPASQWESLLAATSRAIVDSGGVPLVSAGASAGCPGGFTEAYAGRIFDDADILVIADGSPGARLIKSTCGPQAGGCALLHGSVIFLGYLDHFYARGALAHEIGHCFGLRHSLSQSDVMYSQAGFGNVLSRAYLDAMRGYDGSAAVTAGAQAITCERMER